MHQSFNLIIAVVYYNQIERTYKQRNDDLNGEYKRLETELRTIMGEMESQTTATVNELESERSRLLEQIKALFGAIKHNESNHRKAIEELNQNVILIESRISKLREFERNVDKSKAKECKCESVCGESSEEQLRSKLNEMLAKESAYEETLSNADKIIESLEHNYRQRITELEASEASLRARLSQLEENESRLRSSLRTDRRSSEGLTKASDLVQQLIDSGDREANLKQQIKSLEAAVVAIETQLRTCDQSKARIESELRDQDDLLETVHQLQEANQSLRAELNRSLASQDSLQEMLKQTESYYQKRDEEMQKKYKCLEDEKCSLELTITRMNHSSKINYGEGAHKRTSSDVAFGDGSQKGSEREIISLGTSLDPIMGDMEKCLQRAMAVVRLEISQKVCPDDESLPCPESNTLSQIDRINSNLEV